MNDLLSSRQDPKTAGSDVLSARLLYLALKCPLLQGGVCSESSTAGKRQAARTERPQVEDDALVDLRIVLPYGLRKQALAQHINCSALFRRALRRSLVARRSAGARCE